MPLLVGIGARFDQQTDDVGVAFGGGIHEGGRALELLGGVHVGAAREEQPHGRNAARARRGLERRFTLGMRLRRIGAGAKEDLHHRGVADPARVQEGSDAEVVGRINRGFRGDQRARDLDVGAVGCPEKRRGAVAGTGVHVCAGFDQRADRLEVARLDRLRQRRVAGRAGDGHEHGCRQETRYREMNDAGHQALLSSW